MVKALLANRIAVALIACTFSPLLHADSATEANDTSARRDCEAALRTWREWAQQGNAEAEYFLSTLYHNGRIVAKDPDEALRWLRPAADQGLAMAQYDLGIFYRDGRGVVRDEATYVQWNRKAAEQGFAPAQNNLASQYFNGTRGVARDETEAARWYGKAAEQGYRPSQAPLGAMYIQGRGVPKDLVEAYKWLSLALVGADGKDRDQIAGALAIATKSMTNADVDRALELARKWTPTIGPASFLNAPFFIPMTPRMEEPTALDARRVIEVDAYSVPSPAGDGWKVQVDRYNDGVTFLRNSPGTVELTGINVERSSLAMTAVAREAIDIVTAIECVYLDSFKQEGKKKGYAIGEIIKKTATVGGKSVYLMSYVVTDRRQSVPVEIRYVVHTLLLPNWKESKRAYQVILGQPQKIGDMVLTTNAPDMDSMISGFREK